MSPKILRILLVIICVILVVNIARSYMLLVNKGSVINKAQDKLVQVQNEQEQLKAQYGQVQSQSYIEKQAREKLNLSREGEVVVILPPISPKMEPTPTYVKNGPNWQKWLDIYIK